MLAWQSVAMVLSEIQLLNTPYLKKVKQNKHIKPATGRTLHPCVSAATERRKHTQVDFCGLRAAFAAYSDQLGALGHQRIHVHVTGDKT